MSTPYRNEIDALQERKAALEGEIAKLRDQTTQLDELRAREAQLASELAGIDGKIAARGATRRPLPLLDQVRVASPCKAEWNEMLGDERVRFCLSCEKNVYNLSSMSKDDAEALLRERLGNDLCVRFYQRADGTILTADCPEGVKKKRRKKLALAVAGAGAMAAAAATMFVKTTCSSRQSVGGVVAYQGEPTPVVGAADPDPTEVRGERVAVPPVAPVTDPDPNGGTWSAGGIGVMPSTPPAPTTVQPPQEPHRPMLMGQPSVMGRR